MLSMRQLWERHGLPLILVGAGLSLALFLRQTHGGMIQEFYAVLVGPFVAAEPPVPTETILRDATILALQNQVTNLEQQNQQLKELLKYTEQQSPPAIAAPIIGRSADSWWEQITLGRGKDAGIKPGDAVLGIGGLVGRVNNVTENSSRVVLISDASSRIGAMVTRSRYLGFVTGNGAQKATMVFYDKVPNVKLGDMVMTSNLSVLFPPNVPIGKVVAINLKTSPAPTATLELTAPLEYLEWVTVQPFQARKLEFKPAEDEEQGQNETQK